MTMTTTMLTRARHFTRTVPHLHPSPTLLLPQQQRSHSTHNDNKSIFHDRFVERESSPGSSPSSSSSSSEHGMNSRNSHSIFYNRFVKSSSESSSSSASFSPEDKKTDWDNEMVSRETVLRRGRMWDWNDRKAEHERMIRVDHAGELGAVRICQGQMAVLPNDPVIREIYEEEKVHYERFQQLVGEHRVKPTVMHPIWNVAGVALGAATAMLGRPAAMACHKAVEDVISDHYNDQIRTIYHRREADMQQQMDNEMEEEQGSEEERYKREQFRSAAMPLHGVTDVSATGDVDKVKMQDDKDEQKLKETFVRFRDEEMHHYDLAVENDAHLAPGYNVLYKAIKAGCHAAIWISTRF